MSEATRKLRIHGRVQGVFYRAWGAEAAQSLGLSGWIRNRSDGTVEVLVQGEPRAVQEFIERCRIGPPAAQVSQIAVEDTAEQAPPIFEKRPTL